MTKKFSETLPRKVSAKTNAESSLHILMAEDNIVNQKVAALQIKKLNFRVDVVANGQEAINALEQNSYDVVLMDCQMPGMDGFDTTREIRKREALIAKGELPSEKRFAGNRQHIPIIAMTANDMEENEEKFLKCGMDDFISKPLKQEELEKSLEKWIPGEQDDAQQPVMPEEAVRKKEQHSIVSTATDSPGNLAVLTALHELAGGEHSDVLPSLINEYFKEGHECLDQMAVAIEKIDVNALKKAAHKFKGSSQIIGAERLAELCKALEDMGLNNDFNEINSLFDHLHTEYQRVEEYLKAEMKNL